MPAFVDGSIFSLALDYRLDGQQVLFTTHWQWTAGTPGADSDYASLLTEWFRQVALVGDMCDLVASCYSQDAINGTVLIQCLYPTRYLIASNPSSQPAGLVAHDSLPPGTAQVFTMRSEATGRSQRGTKHMGAVPTNFSANGIPTAPAILAYTNLAERLDDSYSIDVMGATGSLIPVIFHKASPNTSPRITNNIMGGTTRTMKRRVVGRGS